MCDTLCLRSGDGSWFAKNSDRPVDEAQVVAALEAPVQVPAPATVATQYLTIDDPGPGMVCVASRPTWLWGAEHAVNAAGVAIGNEKVWTTDNPRDAAPALIGMDLVRLAAERATTADHAVELITTLIERWGQGGSGEGNADEPYWSSFLVADATSGWVVETSGRTWVAEPTGPGRAISNRLSLARGWTRSSPDVAPGTDWQGFIDPAIPTGLADHRLAATTAVVGAGHADARSLVAALRDHGGGPWGAPGSPAGMGAEPAPAPPAGVGSDWSGITVCMHVADYQCTTASMVAHLPADGDAPVRLWAGIGPACCAVVLPAAIVRTGPVPVAVVPDALGDVALWQAASAAARRAETAGPGASQVLTAVRSVFGPVEAAAADEADGLAADGAGAGAWRQAAQRWSEAARAAAATLAG